MRVTVPIGTIFLHEAAEDQKGPTGQPLVGSIKCTCGATFSVKGFPVHVGMMHRTGPYSKARRERREELKKAKAIEKEAGWAPGTLSNEDGWPKIPKPRTRAQIAEQERVRKAEQDAREVLRKAEDAARALEFAELLAPYLKEEPSVALGNNMRETLDSAGWSVYKQGPEWD